MRSLKDLTAVDRERVLALAQARKIKRKSAPTLPITPINRDGLLELSLAQQRLWFLAQFEGASEAYHISGGIRLKGDLDRSALRRALDRIVERHEVLRTTFSQIDDRPVQLIGPADRGFALQEHDLCHAANPLAELQRLVAREAAEPIDLQRGPLIRGRLAQLAEDDHALLLTMHHIISDGWSMGILVDEMSALYKAYRNGEAESLPALPVQYADYAAWQRRWLSGEVLRRQSDYWKSTLAGAPPLLKLPADRARPAPQNYAGDALEIELGADLTRDLKALGQRQGTTLYMTLLASWAALLGRLSGQEEVVIGTPVANRRHPEIEPLIGCFINTLALRIDFTGSPAVSELLGRVKSRTVEAQEHQEFPFEQVVEIVQPPRSLSHAPVFQAMFAWQSTPEGVPDLPGLTHQLLPAPRSTAQFDLSLSLQESGEQIIGSLEYATSLFDRETVLRYLGHWQTLLAAMVADETQAVGRLPLLGEAERRQVLIEWNATEADSPTANTWQGKYVHELFEQQVERGPETIALVYGEQSLSYGELNARANRLAHHLRELGVGPDVRVAICMERGIELIVALLATLKAGGAYVPLDPAYPPARLDYMLKDSEAAVLITHGAVKAVLATHTLGLLIVNLDTDAVSWAAQSECNLARSRVDARSLAYIIYTSGSTGRPKGVMVGNPGIVNLLSSMHDLVGITSTDCMLALTTLAFDIAGLELFLPMISGARIVLVERAKSHDPIALAEMITMSGVTMVQATPSTWRLLLDAGWHGSPNLKALCGGEALSAELAGRVIERVGKLWNVYGPTETTIWSSAVLVNWKIVAGAQVHIAIGRPIANTQIYIVDERLEPSPVGVPGEIHIGGVGVAWGYFNRPELTAECFLPHPFGEKAGEHIYKTGDLGRWLPDGNIEYLGRNDFQMKIRGFRIELGEIEARLAGHPDVRESVVIACEDNESDRRLVAYYTGEEIGAAALQAHLSAALPGYMVPSAYVHLDSLPLTPNGKLDRKSLPAPEGAAYVRRVYEPPVGEVEAQLARIWAKALNLERVGRSDTFFELGGHSLLAARLVNRIKQETALDIDISVTDLFTYPTVESLAIHVRSRIEDSLQEAVAVPLRTGGADPPLFLVHDIWGEVLYGPKLASHLASGFPVYGLVAPGFSEKPLQTIQAMAARMVRMIRAVQPDGPYRIAGWSFGGTLAYEIATQLIGDDAPVEFLGSLDGSYFGPGTKVPNELLSDTTFDVKDPLSRMQEGTQAYQLLPAGLTADEAARYLERNRNHIAAARGYIAHPIPIPLHLFIAEDMENTGYTSTHHSWEVILPAEQIRTITVPGNHLSMMESPYIASLGEALSRAIHQTSET